jgi:7-cyano-7-deazaguanine reductase
MPADIPLGKASPSPDVYAPEVLCAVPRASGRAALGLDAALPFAGEDVWNAWEVTWLEDGGRPRVAVAVLRVPADSPNLIESKSLKLYLGSFAMTRFGSADAVAARVAADLTRVAGKPVVVELSPVSSVPARIDELPGDNIDGEEVACERWEVDPSLLVRADNGIIEEALHSHLLRSNCPVTGQPDMGSVLVSYRGPRIERAALLRYIVSYRRHCAFHESCIERMWVDIKARCAPQRLTVYGRYTRRGGIDINPFRSDFETRAPNFRLWRQ